jgi:hypothetical protein
MSDYKGWKIPDNIIIVAKDQCAWVDGKYTTTGHYQGYVVDASDKKMLKSAHSWADWTEYVRPYDPVTHAYAGTIEHKGIEFPFTNEGFTLELLESADGSSQGGKLSFWNCKISKDGKEFIIGIASDFLLEILLCNDFIKGKCQTTLSFARCKGGVGMTTKDMPIYQQFIADEEKRDKVKKCKTKKREMGHLYSTLTGGNVHFGKFYRWYEPVYESRGYYYDKKLVGFKRLAEPVTVYWEPWHDNRYTKMSEYAENSFYWSKNTPARVDGGQVVEIDITLDEALDKRLAALFKSDSPTYWCDNYVGISTSDKEYVLPDFIKEYLTNNRLYVLEYEHELDN